MKNTWQESNKESNFSPIKLIPQVRVNASLVVTGRYTTPVYANTKFIPAPEDMFALSVHERLYVTDRKIASPTAINDMNSPKYSQDRYSNHHDQRNNVKFSPIKIRPSTTCFQREGKKLNCAHDSRILLIPTVSNMSAYKNGIDVYPPLRIVMHQKTGVKLPKISPEKPSNGVTRNHHGGFYSTTA